jgi:3-oxoacyl-[acyl-carrier-protein] synthase-3
MPRQDRFASISGWGMYVPQRVLTNDDLARMVDTSDEWIRTRTGIVQRRIADSKESTSHLALAAARQALETANFDPDRLDLIIVATVTPDYLFPATGCLIQDALGASRAGAFDLLAGCSGFVYGLNVATQMIASGSINNALVIGAETLSRIINWSDRDTCVLFGDGAGAFLLQASDTPSGVLSFCLGSDGSGGDLLILPGGGSRHPLTLATVANGLTHVRMNGREVFKFATRVMGHAARDAIQGAGLSINDIDLLIPHQANYRIIQAAAKYLDLPMEKVFVNVDRYGNTSSASIPIAFCEAISESRIKSGDHVVLVAFGAGLTWASAVVQWTPPVVRPMPWWRRQLQSLRYFGLAPVKSLRQRAARKVDTLWMPDSNGHKGNRSRLPKDEPAVPQRTDPDEE